MGVCHPEGHSTDARNTRKEETGYRRVEVPFEGGRGPEGGVVSYIDGFYVDHLVDFF